MGPSSQPLRAHSPLRRLVLVALALAVGVVGEAYARAPGPGVRVEQDVDDEPLVGLERVLADLEGRGRIGPEELLTALLGAGPRGWRELSAALRLRPDSLEASLRAKVESALRRLPRAILVRQEQASSSARRRELELKLALNVLEDFGRAADLPTALRLSTPTDPAQAIDLRLSKAISRTLAQVLTRDLDAFDELARTYRGLDRRLVPLVLRAAGSVPSERAAHFLGEQLGVDAALDGAVIGQLGRVLTLVDAELDERTRTYVLMGLSSPDVGIRREACLTVGRAEETGAVPDLIELLSDPDSGVADNAYWALGQVARKNLDPDPDRWRSWYAAEEHWWQVEAGALFGDLSADDPGIVSRAIRELAVQRLHRHAVALELLGVLDSDNAALVAQACGALAALRSRAARGRLTELLEHPSASVRDNARLALEALPELR